MNLPAAERLVAIAATLRAGRALEAPDAQLAGMLLDHLAREQRRRDGVAIRRAALQSRNQLIRELGRLLPAPVRGNRPDKTGHARLVAGEIRRYRSGRWRRDRELLACPEEIIGTIDGIIWHILKSSSRCPLARRALIDILYP